MGSRQSWVVTGVIGLVAIAWGLILLVRGAWTLSGVALTVVGALLTAVAVWQVRGADRSRRSVRWGFWVGELLVLALSFLLFGRAIDGARLGRGGSSSPLSLVGFCLFSSLCC